MNTKRLQTKLFLLTFILLSIATASTFAQSKKISLQGFLKDANGKAVADGSQSITFKLYTVATGGTAAWTDDQNINVYGGVYSTHLGSVANPVDALNWGSATYYVGVTVQGTELTPRTELTFAPYSLGSPKAQEVVCSGAVGDVKYSILNPTQFAAVNGNCWVPMDGGNMAGSKLATIIGGTTVPNAGGLFLRGQEFSGQTANHDPDRTSVSTIATLQDQAFLSHNHGGNTVSGGLHSHSIYDPGHSHVWNFGLSRDDEGSGGSDDEFTRTSGTTYDAVRASTTGISINNGGTHSHAINSEGSTETRPKNLNLWTYIRIN
jgi:hypothetical protein